MSFKREQLATFLGELFDADDLVELRLIRGKEVQRMWIKPGGVVERFDDLTNLNADGWNIYYGVQPRPHTGAGKSRDIVTVRSLWVDVDGCKPLEAIHRVHDGGLLQPTITVASGNGTHMYWLLADPFAVVSADDRHRVESAARRIASVVGGDSCSDVARILRLPGFDNVKDKSAPIPCEIHAADQHRYELDQIEEYLPEAPQPEQPPTTNNPQSCEPVPPSLAGKAIEELRRTVPDRSGRDHRILCELAGHGCGPEAVWELVRGYSKFAEKGRAYFDTSWPKAANAIRLGVAVESKTETFGQVAALVSHRARCGLPIIETIPTGLGLIDECGGGLVRGEFVGLVGVPGCGKSTLADAIVIGCLQQDDALRAIIFSLETSPPVRVARSISRACVRRSRMGAIECSVRVGELLRGELVGAAVGEVESASAMLTEQVGDRLVFANDTYSAAEIAVRIERDKPDVVLIDHMGLVHADAGGDSDITRSDDTLNMLAAAMRRVNTAGLVINEVHKQAMRENRIDMTASRGTARFASLAAMYVGLERTPAQGISTMPEVKAVLAKNRFGRTDKMQTATFAGEFAWFGWDSVKDAATDGKEQ